MRGLLYNPGGFQVEGLLLRMGVLQAGLLLAGVSYCQLASPQYLSWGALLGLPLLISGIALVHFVVARRKMGGHWLAIFYIGLLLIGPMSLIMVLLGFIDSILNIRARIPAKKS